MRVALPMLSSLCVFLLLLAFLCAASSSSNLTQFCLPPAASSGTSKAISCSGCETVAGCVGACCSPLSDMFGSVLVVLCNVGECFYSFVVYLFRIFLIAALVIYAFWIIFFSFFLALLSQFLAAATVEVKSYKSFRKQLVLFHFFTSICLRYLKYFIFLYI